MRAVVVGDLNASWEALETILVGTGLARPRGGRLRWTGGASRLIQVGDLFNRGGGARRALETLLALGVEARRVGGDVCVLLGNHEVMTTLGHEGYVTEDEYLAFATPRELAAWPGRIYAAWRRFNTPGADGRVLPIPPQIEAWKALHAPGRTALRRALGPRGLLGRAIRALPVAVRVGDAVALHAGVNARWAKRGVDGLNAAAAAAWAAKPRRWADLAPRGPFRDRQGPLWHRRLALADTDEITDELDQVLGHLGAARLIVGHTRTERIGGRPGEVLVRHGGRLVCVDVSLGMGSRPAALIVADDGGFEWSETRVRRLFRRRKSS